MRNWSLWALLPLLYSVSTAAGLVVVYFMALQCDTIGSLGWQNSTTRRAPPYISLAGNQPPASCVFSQVMNFAAFVGFIIGFFRYLQLKPKECRPWLNIASLATFSMACFGMTLVGNFQISHIAEIHQAGTRLAFGVGTVFCWLQSFITFRLNLRKEGRRVGVVRFTLSAAITVSMVLFFTLMAQRLHIHAARTQWCLVMFLLAFIGTFAVEFRHVRFEILCTEHQEPPRIQSETFSELKPKECRPWLNIASLATFSMACFGMTLVGNFQLSHTEDVHNAGTSLVFGVGTLFCWLQSFITLRLNLRKEGRRVGVVRFALSAAITLSMVLYFTLMAQRLHIHAARTQWCLVMFLLAFIGTFA
ncbi:hypothetical protein CRUP_030775, partial [Coryphaenoides rupestris]